MEKCNHQTGDTYYFLRLPGASLNTKSQTNKQNNRKQNRETQERRIQIPHKRETEKRKKKRESSHINRGWEY